MPVSTLPFGRDWMIAYFAMVDRRDLDEFASWYHEDATFRFANQEPARGIVAIRAALSGFYGQLRDMRHEMTGAWADGDSGAFEAIAHFEMTDGRRAALPAVSTMRLRSGLISDFRFVMDATPILGGAAR